MRKETFDELNNSKRAEWAKTYVNRALKNFAEEHADCMDEFLKLSQEAYQGDLILTFFHTFYKQGLAAAWELYNHGEIGFEQFDYLQCQIYARFKRVVGPRRAHIYRDCIGDTDMCWSIIHIE